MAERIAARHRQTAFTEVLAYQKVFPDQNARAQRPFQKVVKFLFYRTGRLFLGNFSSRLKWLWKPFEITATATEWLKNASALPE
jgi:hypothetical protein